MLELALTDLNQIGDSRWRKRQSYGHSAPVTLMNSRRNARYYSTPKLLMKHSSVFQLIRKRENSRKSREKRKREQESLETKIDTLISGTDNTLLPYAIITVFVYR